MKAPKERPSGKAFFQIASKTEKIKRRNAGGNKYLLYTCGIQKR